MFKVLSLDNLSKINELLEDVAAATQAIEKVRYDKDVRIDVFNTASLSKRQDEAGSYLVNGSVVVAAIRERRDTLHTQLKALGVNVDKVNLSDYHIAPPKAPFNKVRWRAV